MAAVVLGCSGGGGSGGSSGSSGSSGGSLSAGSGAAGPPNAAPDAAAPSSAGPIGCAAGADAGGGYDPQIVASDFSTTIDNPYLPMPVGSVQHLKDSDGNLIEITVLSDTKVVAGVTCAVVHDVSRTAAGAITEDTYDWFAQDRAGSVWYFGEDTKAYGAGGLADTTGSWTGGVDCAKPGIVMKAHPAVGDSYRQEFHAGDAEDQSDVISLDESVTVTYGTFQHCLKTRDYSRLEPGADENKFYCAGFGNVLTLDLPVSVGKREELVSVSGPEFDGGSSDATPPD
jgi:hypothetical protein